MTAPLALPPGGRDRPRQLVVLGALLGVAAVVAGIGALLSAWVQVKGVNGVWPPADTPEVDNYPASMAVATVALMSVIVEWAAWAVRRGERRQAIAALATTIGLALAFLNLLWYFGSQLGFGPGESAYGSLLFALLVACGAVAVVAAGAGLVALGKTIARQADPAEPDSVRAAACLTHAATAAWAVTWLVVFFPGLIFK